MLWYKQPAVEWMTSALPIENGRIGSITSEQKITIGFVINTNTPSIGVYNEVIIKSVGLYK